MREVYRDEYFTVSLDEADGFVRADRSNVPLPDVEVYARFADSLEVRFTRRERARLALLVDVRNAPLRSDEGFETRMQEIGARLVAGWSRHALLVRTAVGKLQMARQSRASGTQYSTYDDEAAAIAYLKSRESIRPPKAR